jgi:hypothetical protein
MKGADIIELRYIQAKNGRRELARSAGVDQGRLT